MDIFAEVRSRVDLRQAAELYGLKPNRAGFVRCPFHGDKTPSLKLWQDHWYCFGCHTGGSVIDLAAKLFSLTPLEAVKRLDRDFGLNLPEVRPMTEREKAALADDADPFNRISGTAAISGAADTMIVLSRDKRSADTTRLSATGRDIREMELELRFEKARCRWVNLGDAGALAAKRAMEEYEASPIVKTVRKLLSQSAAGEWTGTATQLMEAGKYIAGQYLAPSAKALTMTLRDFERSLFENDGIIHTTGSNGNAGKRHTFRYAMGAQFSEPEDQQELPF